MRSFRPVAAAAQIIDDGRALRRARTEDDARLLPGDELLSTADVIATDGIAINARPENVWPWIAQLGQDRGGFYSYDTLENLAGCDIHSADRIHPEWQEPEVGSDVPLAPELALTVASITENESLVLRGAPPLAGAPAMPFDFTWSFTLIPGPDTATTRLVVRERYTYRRPWAGMIVHPTAAVSRVMSRKMLSGIKGRALRTASAMRTSG